MADVVIDANAVGQLVTYVAPGFLARVGYRARYPGPDEPAGEVLIISVVVSLPLVAAVTALLPGAQKPTQLGYVALLLAVGLIGGYLVALARGTRRVKGVLARVGYTLEPPGSIYASTLREMSPEGTVVVELKDGRRVLGYPRIGPQHKDDGITELYLTYPEAQPPTGGEWLAVGEGIIIPLSDIGSITLSEEPTGAAYDQPDVDDATDDEHPVIVTGGND
jgi:hypothetical protein